MNTRKTFTTLFLFTAALAIAGCSGSSTGTDDEPGSGSAATPASSQSSATGTGSSSPSNPYLGTWSLGGTQSTTCGTASSSNQLNGVVIITNSGPDDDTHQNQGALRIDTKYSSTCSMTWDVKGEEASVEKAQVCTVAVGEANVTVSLTSGTMTMQNSHAMTVLLSGVAANGCSFTQQETLTLM